jgi:transposase
LIELSKDDRTYLDRLVRDGRTEQRVARRARILLAMGDPKTVVGELAEHLDVARTTIWTLYRRYEAVGVEAVGDAARDGRPRALSPPASRRD